MDQAQGRLVLNDILRFSARIPEETSRNMGIMREVDASQSYRVVSFFT
jgi:hypothetical protein